MQVSLLGAAVFTDAEADLAVTRHLGATKVPLIPQFIVVRMLKAYREYRKDGMRHAWILGEMKKKRVDITAGAYLPSDAQILGFVTALSRLEKGDTPTDPWERPSWAEAYGMGLGKAFQSDTAKSVVLTVALVVGGAIVLHGFAGGLAKR